MCITRQKTYTLSHAVIFLLIGNSLSLSFDRSELAIIYLTMFHRTAELLRLAVTSGGQLVSLSFSQCSSFEHSPMLKHGHLQEVAEDHIQLAFEDLHNLFGQPVSVLSHLHHKEVLPSVQWEPLMFQFLPTASCPNTRHNLMERVQIFRLSGSNICNSTNSTNNAVFQ